MSFTIKTGVSEVPGGNETKYGALYEALLGTDNGEWIAIEGIERAKSDSIVIACRSYINYQHHRNIQVRNRRSEGDLYTLYMRLTPIDE